MKEHYVQKIVAFGIGGNDGDMSEAAKAELNTLAGNPKHAAQIAGYSLFERKRLDYQKFICRN